MKEQGKNSQDQINEEEIDKLSEKEFRIMIVKMIQNLENKMELQINSLETRIEKMQDMFNKDLEEIKNVCKNQDSLKDEQRAIVPLDINIKHNNCFRVLMAEMRTA